MLGPELVTVAIWIVAFTMALSQQGLELLAKAAAAFGSSEIGERELTTPFQQVTGIHHLMQMTSQSLFRNSQETRECRGGMRFSHALAAQPEHELQDFVAPEDMILFFHPQRLT